jgi:flagellar hook-associated protein 2
MSTPITFSGFNNIDFNTVLTALMAQASQPLTALQTQQSNVKAQSTTYGTLATQLSALNDAAQALGSSGDVTTFSATSSDATAVAATVGSGATAGAYDVVVNQLAKAQVTASASTAPDANTTVVATGGSITIGGATVTISGSVTLQQLANQINATAGTGVTASVVQSGASAFRLVLTGQATGASHAFTVTNALTGGAGVTFTDTNSDGISGNSAADNAQQALSADFLVNNVEVVSDTNTVSAAIPGVTLQLSRQDPLTTVSINVAADGSSLQASLQAFVSAYNTFHSFVTSQQQAAANGDQTSIGRESLLRGLTQQLNGSIRGAYGSGLFQHLAEVGVEFTQTGTLQLNTAMFSSAIAQNPGAVQSLVAGASEAFDSVSSTITQYTQSNGLISIAQQALSSQSSQLDNQITNMQNRLNIERATLQLQFTAADTAISTLQSQTSSLSQLNGSLSSLSQG